ncbi:aminoacyl-tRNA hydrolase [Pseudothermotoga sp.]|nr:aminoacyl-tRNA hydrolase [Pseudothermotoga sp.]MCX7812333.1 aminoacyl-tRNA hydrolase [Pseudothermotoga sp.]MDW8139403.1 aminoacyl-tRNA hydrolase [Pseudothermotoga sp.]
MKHFVIGLGNPGPRYALNRHNVGFIFLDKYIEKLGCNSNFVREESYELMNCGTVCLVKPLTYMNVSGEAVKMLLVRYNLSVDDIIIVYDDIDLPLGKIRIRQRGSAGGHNGLKSIIEALETDEIVRVRIGIGPKPEGIDLAQFVLSNFSSEELVILDKVLDVAVEAVQVILSEGVQKAMSLYNSLEVIV